jgi:ABC-type polysaccharide/polyol phosphate export permease
MLLAPALHYALIGTVLAILNGSGVRTVLPYYLSGAAFYSLFAGIVGTAPSVMAINEQFIKKVAIPKAIYVLNAAAVEAVIFGFASVSLGILGAVSGFVHPSWAVSVSFLAVAFTAAFALGIACVLSVVAVWFRDVSHFTPVLLQAFFFLTPAVYQIEMLPLGLQPIVRANPLTLFLTIFREPLLNGTLPEPINLFTALVIAAASLAFGFAVLRMFDNRIVFRL